MNNKRLESLTIYADYDHEQFYVPLAEFLQETTSLREFIIKKMPSFNVQAFCDGFDGPLLIILGVLQ